MRDLVMPQLGTNDEEVTIVRWLVDPGAEVSVAQQVAELETSKAAFTLECDYAGYLYPLVDAGQMVEVGGSIALVLDQPDADAARAERARRQAAAPGAEGGAQLTARALRLVEAAGIDPASLPTGRVLRESDVRTLIGPPVEGDDALRETSLDAAEPQTGRGADPSRRVAIYGASQGGLALRETVAQMGAYEVCAFLDDTPGLAGGQLAGLPVLPGDHLGRLPEEGIGALATHIAADRFRLSLRDRARAAGVMLVNVIHPAAVMAPSARLGVGNVIKAGAIVDAHVRVGDCCIIDNGVIVPHNNVLGDGCHLAPGVRVGGDCIIGEATLVGVGAIVTSRVRIGANAIVSPGAVVMGDVADAVVVAGVPARVIGQRR